MGASRINPKYIVGSTNGVASPPKGSDAERKKRNEDRQKKYGIPDMHHSGRKLPEGY